MKKVRTSAPGKVILFGEHAVVYDKLGIATSVGLETLVEVIQNNDNIVSYEIEDYGLKKTMTEKELLEFFNLIEKLKKEKKFDEIKEIQKKEKLSAAFFVISTLMKRYGFKPVRITGKTNVKKNLGSGSSAFSAIALSLSKYLGKEISKKEISDLAYEGDIVAHGGTPSGIDNSAVTYGGYISYRKSEGIKKLDINFELPLIFVDSGEPSRTVETVPYIRDQRNGNREFVDKVLDRLDDISIQSLEYYIELKKLNISTEKLDKIVEIAIKNKALGAKPTGGWGGGCCIVLVKGQEQAKKLMEVYKQRGFNSFQTKIGVEGVKEIL